MACNFCNLFNSCNSCNSCNCWNSWGNVAGITFPDFVCNRCCNRCCRDDDFVGGISDNDCDCDDRRCRRCHRCCCDRDCD